VGGGGGGGVGGGIINLPLKYKVKGNDLTKNFFSVSWCILVLG
jgi:hypothetical protein